MAWATAFPLLGIMLAPALQVSAFSPHGRSRLKSAADGCLSDSAAGDCSDYYLGAIGTWNVLRVTDMHDMFWNAKTFNADISKWDVSRVTDMNSMFQFAQAFNADISEWDVSRVTDMKGMFNGAFAFNADVSEWDVSRVTDMEDMFWGAKSFARTLCGTWVLSTAKGKGDMLGQSPGSMGLHPAVCIPNWSPAVIVVVIIVVTVVAACGYNGFWETRREQRRAHAHFFSTEEYQHDVRRQWLRGLHALTDGEERVWGFPRAVRDDPNVSELLEFFRTYPGLRRQVGAIMALHYSPSSAPAFLSREHNLSRGHNRTRVIPYQKMGSDLAR